MASTGRIPLWLIALVGGLAALVFWLYSFMVHILVRFFFIDSIYWKD